MANLEQKILDIIVKFDYDFPRQRIYTGFLAGMLKVSKEAIRVNLIKLQEKDLIKRVMIKKNSAGYVYYKRR